MAKQSKANEPKEVQKEEMQKEDAVANKPDQGMNYEVRFSSFNEVSSVRGICSVTINKEFAIRGVKVVEGSKGLFVAMPSYKSGDEYKDICFPVTSEGRKNLTDAVLKAYEQQVSQHQSNEEIAAMGQEAPEGTPIQAAM